LWTGSDDGLLHVSRDGGKNWDNVTPKDAPKWIMWNSIDADPFKKGAAYAVGTKYKSDDFTPYVYKTEDYGRSWKLITNGIAPTDFVRVVRADQKRPGLLYAGTEYGMYISFDDGANWKRFQLNLPMVPVTDLTIKENDLVVATQGRAFYVLDDLTVLQQMNNSVLNKNLHVFDVTPAYRMPGSPFAQNFGTPRNAGVNPPAGVVVNYFVKDLGDSTKASFTVFDRDHKLIKAYTSDSKENNTKFDVNKGMNQAVWDMRYTEAERIEGMILWNGVPGAITAPPGNYFARLKVGQDSVEVPFTIRPDPNYKVSQQEYDEQFAFLAQVRDKFNETQKAIKDIRALRTQINSFVGLQGKDVPKEVKQMADSINKQLTSIEEILYQTKSKSGQDVLNYPIRLNDKLSGVFDAANSGNFAPSKQVREVYNDLASQIDAQIARLNAIKQKDIPAFNELIRQKALPVIGVK
jgi:hypothetical protein